MRVLVEGAANRGTVPFEVWWWWTEEMGRVCDLRTCMLDYAFVGGRVDEW